MKLKLGVAVVTAVAGLAIGAAPASADPPEFGCYDQKTGVELIPLPTPGSDNWRTAVVEKCIGTGDLGHPKPVK
jgi:hypothetical protein